MPRRKYLTLGMGCDDNRLQKSPTRGLCYGPVDLDNKSTIHFFAVVHAACATRQVNLQAVSIGTSLLLFANGFSKVARLLPANILKPIGTLGSTNVEAASPCS